jgi:hypothetical protein
MTAHHPFGDARDALRAWRAAMPDDLAGADAHLDIVNALALDGERLDRVRDAARSFGRVVTTEIGPLVEHYRTRLPQLVSYDGHGNPIDEVRFDHAYHTAGRLVWESGLLTHAAAAGASFETATLFYLASHEGEMGHMCAATCTTGLVRVLRRHADPALAARYLPALTASDYARALRGAQFLTEVQGGSDVGANASMARRMADGSFAITGEKWFCSVADAGAFLLLARPEGAAGGTTGLACFVMPRLVDGKLNGIRIRRLKDKLGTTAMASGEIDFRDARADAVGELDAGFKIMVTAMLNTSRWLNALGDVGMMRRAYLEASTYARARRAFGVRIADFPLVRRQLAEMKAEWLGALHSTWHQTALDEVTDVASMGGAPADPADVAFHRFLVNANKLACSVAATSVVRQGIEVLGGNGAIEDFSVLPRLLRDAVVYEQWEGTHNVLTAQVLRDIGRLGLQPAVLGRIATTLKGIAGVDAGDVAERALESLDEAADDVAHCVADARHGAMHFRAVLDRLVRLHQVALLLQASDSGHAAGWRDELVGTARLLLGRHVDHSYRADDDPRFAATIEAVLGGDAGD